MRKLNIMATVAAFAIAALALTSCSIGAGRPGYRYIHDSAADVDIDTGEHLHNVWQPVERSTPTR